MIDDDDDDEWQESVLRGDDDGSALRPVQAVCFYDSTQELRGAIAAKIGELAGLSLNLEHEITVTSGATEALFCAIAAVVQAGDEVIVFDPAYDSYQPAVNLQGAKTVHIPLQAPGYKVDWTRVADAITPKTIHVFPSISGQFRCHFKTIWLNQVERSQYTIQTG